MSELTRFDIIGAGTQGHDPRAYKDPDPQEQRENSKQASGAIAGVLFLVAFAAVAVYFIGRTVWGILFPVFV